MSLDDDTRDELLELRRMVRTVAAQLSDAAIQTTTFDAVIGERLRQQLLGEMAGDSVAEVATAAAEAEDRGLGIVQAEFASWTPEKRQGVWMAQAKALGPHLLLAAEEIVLGYIEALDEAPTADQIGLEQIVLAAAGKLRYAELESVNS